MLKKILKKLTNNLGFKLLAVLFAFAMWLVVYNIDDPSSSKNFTATVTIQNAQSISDMNKCYEVIDGTGTVSFRVTAKRSILEKLDYSDFTAIADMSLMNVSDDGAEGSVPIAISANNYTSSVKVSGLTKYLKVSLEDLQEKQFVITADTKGKVADGFTLGDVSVSNPNVIKVSGPASVVGQISKVVATIDVSGMSVDISDNVVPAFYDEDDKTVDTTKLTLSSNTVTVSAKILSTKEVPIHFNTSGTPADTYSVVEITSDPETVQIKGSSSVLNPISSLEIPEEVLNVEGANKDITTSIDISEYLPDGVSLTKNSQATVSVTIRIEPYTTQNYNIPVANISVNGLDDNYNLAFGQTTVNAAVSGMSSDLSSLNANSIKGSIDVSSLGEGTHTVDVTLTLDADKFVQQTTTTDVTITRKPDGTTSTTTNDDNTNHNTSNSESTGNNTGNGTTGTTGEDSDNKTTREDGTDNNSTGSSSTTNGH